MDSTSSISTFNYIQIPIPVFKGEAYECWSIQMRTLFISQDLFDVVEEEYQELASKEELAQWSAEKQEEYKKKKQKDAKALYFLQQGVDPTIFPKIMLAKTSKEAWNILENSFKNFSQVIELPGDDSGHTDNDVSTKSPGKPGEQTPNRYEMDNLVLVTAALIATVTYQAMLTPPTSIAQEDVKLNARCIIIDDNRTFRELKDDCPAAMFYIFMILNTAGFFSSAAVIIAVMRSYALAHNHPPSKLLIISILLLLFNYVVFIVGLSPDFSSLYVVVGLSGVIVVLLFATGPEVIRVITLFKWKLDQRRQVARSAP